MAGLPAAAALGAELMTVHACAEVALQTAQTAALGPKVLANPPQPCWR